MLTGLYTMYPERFDDVYGPDERARIERLVKVPSPPLSAEDLRANLGLLRDVQVLLTSWGGPRLDEELLDAAPGLELVLYAAGTLRPVVTDAFWERDIPIVSAHTANAVPVVEFAVAQVVLALKHVWRYMLEARHTRRAAAPAVEHGCAGSVVGLLSLGAVGRQMCEALRHYDVRLQASDPYADPEECARLGVEMVGMEELFATSDVVTVHTPLLPETRGLVDESLLSSMKRDATIVNTSRGAVLDEPALVRVLRRRPDLFAVLDVTDPEPPADGSPLFTLPNVVVTPHLAGSLGRERRRLGGLVADELDRYVRGEALRWTVSRDAFSRMA